MVIIGCSLAILGLISGPSALHSAQMAQPPLEWSDLAVIFAGCAIGIFLVLGFQVLMRQFRGLRWGWWIFGANAAFFLGAGVSALAVGIGTGALGTASMLFLVVGLGISVAFVLCRMVFGQYLQPNPAFESGRAKSGAPAQRER
jgi:hypothetical protein